MISTILISSLLLCSSHRGLAERSISDTSSFEITDLPKNATVPKRHLRASKIDPKAEGQLPSVFIIGAQKGGALSLLDLMIHHPLLCGGIHKEPNFFSDEGNYATGAKDYKDLFRDAKCHNNAKYSKYIDGTPMLHVPQVWSRIVETYNKEKDGKKLKDNLKFIVLLREPVSRDFVWYQHILRNSLHAGQKFVDVKTIKELSEETKFLDTKGVDTRYGRYIEQLQEFTKYFRRDQLLILNSQVIFDDAASIMNNVYQFLNVPDEKVPNLVLPRVNHYLETSTAFETCTIHHIPEMDCSYRDSLGEYYEPFNVQLYYWIKATRPDANANEPPIFPPFNAYKTNACSDDARKEYNDYLGKEQEVIQLRAEFKTKTNGFNMPVGSCRRDRSEVMAEKAAEQAAREKDEQRLIDKQNELKKTKIPAEKGIK